MNKFVFIKDGIIREIHMRAFIDSAPQYILNHDIFIKENISSHTIKRFGKYICSLLNSYHFYKPELPFNTHEFEALSMKYILIANQIKSIEYFYNSNVYNYSTINIESLIQIMKNITSSIILQNDDYDTDALHICIDSLERWFKYDYSTIGWHNDTDNIDENVYILLYDIGTTFLHCGADEYNGYWV